MKKNVGLYVHVPYCRSKCHYCDFYSVPAKGEATGLYAKQAAAVLRQLGSRYSRKADTLYFGGGTPPMMQQQDFAVILEEAKEVFAITADAEITCEMNPGGGYAVSVEDLAALGVNRLSVGLQSGLPRELQALGRRHTPEDAAQLVMRAKKAGIENCSLDLMWGIPYQTVQTALQSVEFALSLQPTHLSAYMLKIEPDTPFGRDRTLQLPEEDTVCEIYERCCQRLEQAGYIRYEISNFAMPGYESRHNLKYWNCEETLGIGPAAHSFMEGKRFYFPSDVSSFLHNPRCVSDGTGGDFAEYAMLQLRLRKGLCETDCQKRFGHGLPSALVQKATLLSAHGLVELKDESVRLTLKGNLVSNEIIVQLLS